MPPRGNFKLADRLMQKVADAINTVQNKDVGILGLAFKPNTNSVRDRRRCNWRRTCWRRSAGRAYDPVPFPMRGCN